MNNRQRRNFREPRDDLQGGSGARETEVPHSTSLCQHVLVVISKAGADGIGQGATPPRRAASRLGPGVAE